MQEEIQRQYEEEYAAYEAGTYREQPHDWLGTSWQGDALQARCMIGAHLLGHSLPGLHHQLWTVTLTANNKFQVTL